MSERVLRPSWKLVSEAALTRGIQRDSLSFYRASNQRPFIVGRRREGLSTWASSV